MKAQQTFLRLHSRELLLTGYGLQAATRCVVIVPPFAEELNKCRRMMALQGRALAGAGIACCYIDLSGTGDSAGEFSDARWENWTGEVHALLQWLASDNGITSIDLLGIRLGAILAAECAQHAPVPVNHLLLWQPVTSGQQYLKQFLRTRVMAAVLGGTQARESVNDLRQQLSETGVLEVAGYTIDNALAHAIEHRRLSDKLTALDIATTWFEIQPEAGAVSPATSRTLARLAAPHKVVAKTVAGEPFWSTAEIGLAPELIVQTVQALSSP